MLAFTSSIVKVAHVIWLAITHRLDKTNMEQTTNHLSLMHLVHHLPSKTADREVVSSVDLKVVVVKMQQTLQS